MSDYLVDLSQNPLFRRTIKKLRVPLPMPEKLRRADGPWAARPLHDATVIFGGTGELASICAQTLAQAGASSHVVGEPEAVTPFLAPGEAWARPTVLHAGHDEAPDSLRARALVFDATGLKTPAELRALYDFFHGWLGRLERSGRVLLLARPESVSDSGSAAAVSAGICGFTRALSKEVGREGGTTANVIFVAPKAEPRLPPLLRFLLSARSAFISGQPFTLDGQAKIVADPPLVRCLERKTAVVTGAARGIGEATARALAAEGAHVVCLDRPEDQGLCGQLARAIGGTPLGLDVTDTEAPGRLCDFLHERWGGVDVFVHNAGITRDKTLVHMRPEWWDQAVAVNLGAVVSITHALAEAGILRAFCRVTCLSSVSGIAGNAGQTNYSASKAGLTGYVRAMAKPLGKRGITINAVAPGFIETRLTDAMPVGTREIARRLSALGQGGCARDVAELVTFLSSPGASGVTGQVIRVCGGMLVGA